MQLVALFYWIITYSLQVSVEPARNLRTHPRDEDDLEPTSRAMQAEANQVSEHFTLKNWKQWDWQTKRSKPKSCWRTWSNVSYASLLSFYMHLLVFQFHLVTLHPRHEPSWLHYMSLTHKNDDPWILWHISHPSAPHKSRCQTPSGQGAEHTDLGGTVHEVHMDMGGLGSWAWVKKSITRTHYGDFPKWRCPKWMVYNGKSYR